MFRDNLRAHERSTLAVICLPLGAWVGGLFTTFCCRHLSCKGYRLLISTPGNKVPDVLAAVQDLAGKVEQTVLLGYPPFVKAVIDAGLSQVGAVCES